MHNLKLLNKVDVVLVMILPVGYTYLVVSDILIVTVVPSTEYLSLDPGEE